MGFILIKVRLLLLMPPLSIFHRFIQQLHLLFTLPVTPCHCWTLFWFHFTSVQIMMFLFPQIIMVSIFWGFFLSSHGMIRLVGLLLDSIVFGFISLMVGSVGSHQKLGCYHRRLTYVTYCYHQC